MILDSISSAIQLPVQLVILNINTYGYLVPQVQLEVQISWRSDVALATGTSCVVGAVCQQNVRRIN
jgi:hypothetical protein